MKCPNCHSTVPASMNYCPYCNQMMPTNSLTSEPEVIGKTPCTRKDLIKGILQVVAIFLSIYLVFTLCSSLFENRGGYEISGYALFSDASKVTYHGRLSKLCSKEYDLLEDFLYREKVSGKRVCHLVCNDYTLLHCDPGDLGTIDVLEDHVTLYKEGLHVYTVTTGNDERFFDDFIFCIEELDSGHEFYFYSLSDVEDWIADRV